MVVGRGGSIQEDRIPRDRAGPQRGGIRKVRTIGGHLYACSGNRGLGRREAEGVWVSLREGIAPKSGGFDDFDAFENGEIYTVGEGGLVHRRDRKGTWTKLNFPADYCLTAVCCAGDGFAYISTSGGSLFRGLEHRWHEIRRGSDWHSVRQGEMPPLPSERFHDLVWHHGRVYGYTGAALFEIAGGEVRPAEVPADVALCSEHLYASAGHLLVASQRGAAYHDGSAWRVLFLRD